jgi:hypothetical protein
MLGLYIRDIPGFVGYYLFVCEERTSESAETKHGQSSALFLCLSVLTAIACTAIITHA